MCIRCCVSMWMCSLMVANATKPHPIFPRGVWQQLFWLDHNFKIKLPDTSIWLFLLILVRNGQWTISVGYIAKVAKVAILGMAIRENSCGLIY